MDYNKKTKKELIEEIEKLKEELSFSQINEKGLDVVNKYEESLHIKEEPVRFLNENGRHSLKESDILHEELLKEGEEKYKFLFYKNPMPMWLYDYETLKFLDVNEAAIHHYGYSKKEFLSMTLNDIRDAKGIKKLKEFLLTTIRQDGIMGEWEHIKKNGEKIHVEIIRGSIQQSGKSVNVSIINDITEKKLKENYLVERENKLKLHNKVIVELAKISAKEELTLREVFSEAIKTSANTLNICRVGIWLLEKENTKLTCNLLFDNGDYSSGQQLLASKYPKYFEALEKERIIVAEDARLNPVTACFDTDYHLPNEIKSLLDVPLRYKGKVVGVICFENCGEMRKWTIEEQNFASSVADLINLAFENNERKKSEKALAQSERSFRMLAENAIDVVYRYQIQPETRYEFVSASVKEMTGYAQEDFYNDPFLGFKLVHPDDVHLLGDSEQLIKENTDVSDVRDAATLLRWVKKDGGIIWTETRNQGIMDSSGKLVAIEGISRDITKRIQLEEELRKSKENYKQLLDALPGGVLIHNDGKIDYANAAAFKIFGVEDHEQEKADEFSIYDFIHPRYVRKIKEREERVLAGEQFHFLEIQAIRPDGKVIHLETKSIAITYNGKKTIQSIFNDISYRKGVESTLRESEEKFRLLSAAAPIGIFLTDPQGKIIYSNDKLKEIAGTSDNISSISDWENIVHKEDKNYINEIISVNLKKGINFTQEFRIIHCNKEMKWVKFIGTKINFKGSLDKGWVGIVKDITQRKDSEVLLIESEKRFRLLSDAAMEGIVLSENGVIIDANDRFVSMHGFRNRQDVLMKNLEDFIDVDYHQAFFREAHQEEGKSIEIKTLHKKGDKIFVEAKTSKIPYHGRVVEVTALTDITERKNYEQELEQSRENYRSLIETSPDGIMIYMAGEFVFANPVAKKFFGLPKSRKVSTSSIFNSIAENQHVLLREKLENPASLHGSNSFSISLKTIDSNEIDAEAQLIPFIYMGKPAIMLVLHDFTNQKKLAREELRAQMAEESNRILQNEIKEHKKTQRKLIETEKYTRNIIDSSLDMICATDKDGRITEFNKAAEKAFGYKSHEVIGKSSEILYADEESFKRTTKEIIQVGKFEGEILNKRKNGETFISFLAAANLYSKEGTFIGVMGVSRDVTKIKQAETEIKLSEAKYRAIYNQAYIGIARVGLIKGEFIEVNQRLCDILGYTREELYEKTTWDITHPDDLYIPERKDFLKNRGEKVSAEKKYLHKDGSVIYANLTISLIFDEKGLPDYFVCVYEDITERKAAEQQLRISEETYRAIYNQVFIGIGKVGLDGRFLFANAQLENILGFTEDELRERTFMDITVKEDLENSKKFQRQLIAGNIENFTTEKRYQKKDGSIVHVVLTSSLVKDLTGTPAYFLSVFQDITSKKLAEEKISKQSARLKAIFESPSHQFYTINNKRILTSFNETYSDSVFNAFGIRPEVGLNASEASKVLFSLEQFLNFERSHMEALGGRSHSYLFNVTNMRGEVIWYESHLNPIILPDGSIEEVSYVTQEITEKKRSEEQIRQSLREKEVLLKEVHHRVKNNLQVISSILNLQSSYVKDKYTLDMLRESQNRIKSMSFIHESLYQTKDFAEINFSEYVVNLAKNLMHSYRIYDDTIELKLDIDTVHLNLDMAIPCGLVINELVSNSLKYAFPASRKGSIFIGLKHIDSQVEIRIFDDGIGMPENIDFRNTESLGLQLVVTLVEQLNGEIGKEPGEGTCYFITFKANQHNNRLN